MNHRGTKVQRNSQFNYEGGVETPLPILGIRLDAVEPVVFDSISLRLGAFLVDERNKC